jgi:hypothetical protein
MAICLRTQVEAVCLKIGGGDRPFDYVDVIREFPLSPYRPTEHQVVGILSTADFLEIYLRGNHHRRTKYKLRQGS